MREHIKYNNRTDFEIGLQLGVEKLALTKPKDTFAGIERWVTNFVTTYLVFGFVFMNKDGKKKIFRLEDAAKYSDETLTRISNNVDKLKGSEFV